MYGFEKIISIKSDNKTLERGSCIEKLPAASLRFEVQNVPVVPKRKNRGRNRQSEGFFFLVL
jgi:hypothetical protein